MTNRNTDQILEAAKLEVTNDEPEIVEGYDLRAYYGGNADTIFVELGEGVNILRWLVTVHEYRDAHGRVVKIGFDLKRY